MGKTATDERAPEPRYLVFYRASNGKRVALVRVRIGCIDDIEHTTDGGDRAKTRLQYNMPTGRRFVDVCETFEAVARALSIEGVAT